MSPLGLDVSFLSPSENHGDGGASGGANAVGSTNDGPSHDEILIQYLILNPCLWDKSNAGFRNRSLKDAKWKEVASRIGMSGEYLRFMCVCVCVGWYTLQKKLNMNVFGST